MIHSLRIAVADDEPEIRDFFRRFLSRLGHSVVGEACDGAQLVELCKAEHPDLVITDLAMPEMDGVSAIAAIATCSKIPVIIVSSHDRPCEPCHPSVVAYLVKPIEGGELEEAIEKVAESLERADSDHAKSALPPNQQ
ncbi:response regulator [Thalassoroseus pseudoceratinae]|uniref:response regulator n=1 Tax=Thalassoroseus pseudoceratinae TaxID=2713176 RepID=UPI0014243501|nr:response regulator [Thalassoroseus pseudoceratinae]